MSQEGLACRSPRFDPNGKYLVWLERNISGAHNHVHRIMYMKWDVAGSVSLLILMTLLHILFESYQSNFFPCIRLKKNQFDVFIVYFIIYLLFQQPSILVDNVKKFTEINKNKKFYGLYNQSFPKRCWSDDSKYLFFSTPQRSSVKSYFVNLGT